MDAAPENFVICPDDGEPVAVTVPPPLGVVQVPSNFSQPELHAVHRAVIVEYAVSAA
jgi:hypothetical protein